MTPPTNNWW